MTSGLQLASLVIWRILLSRLLLLSGKIVLTVRKDSTDLEIKKESIGCPSKKESALVGFEVEKQIDIEQHPSQKIVVICWRLRRIVSVALPRLQYWLIVKSYQDCSN